MGTTGLIYVAIVAAWAAYLVPMLLRRNDEEGRRRSAQKYSSSTARVLSRQSGEAHRARYVVRPRSSSVDVPVEEARSPETPPAGSSAAGTSDAPRPYASNRAARMAAMRRRRVLSILMLSLLSVTALVSFAMLPWWSLTVPVVLIVVFVAAVRVQLRRAARIRAEVHAARIARAEAYHD